MQAELFRAGFRAYLEYRRKGCHEAAQLPLLIVAFALLTLVGCVGEDNLETPYYAIPYYTFWGFVLRIVYQMRVAARSGRSEAHTSELQSLMRISYALFCLKKKHTQHS